MKYYIGFVVAVLLLFFGVKFIFFSSPKKKDTSINTVQSVSSSDKSKTLPDYSSSDAKVSVTVRAPLTADEMQYSFRITVGRDQRVIDVYQGYNDVLVNSKSYENNHNAYDAFLRGINSLGFLAEQKAQVADERNACPLGKHYTYELADTGNSKTDKKLWSVTCGIPVGSAATKVGPTIRGLFQQQIPDFNMLTQNTGLL